MLIDVENMADFIQYYGQRYLRGRDGRVYWVVAHGRHPHGVNVAEFFVSHPTENRWVSEQIRYEDLPTRVFFGLPPLGTLAINDELLYLSYMPVRDGGRGLDTRRILCHSFNNFDLHKHKIEVFSVDTFRRQVLPDKVRAVLYPEYSDTQTITEALANPEITRLAFAIDANFGVYLSSQSDVPMLTYKDSVCGTWESGEPKFQSNVAKLVWDGAQQ